MASGGKRSKSSARVHEKASKRPRAKSPDGLAAPYEAYAVTKDGSRRRLRDVHKLFIGVGRAEIEIALTVPHPIVRGRVAIRVRGKRGERVLVLGPGDANRVYLGSADRFGVP
jgi:hypothetical protein